MQLSKEKEEIFERLSPMKAVLKLSGPAIMSHIVTLIYNMVDTYFVGRTGDPYQVGAVSMAFNFFIILSAVGALYGVGGGSLISRYLGAKRFDMVKKTSSFSFYIGLCTSVVFSFAVLIFMRPFLAVAGASENTYGYCRDYVLWVVVIGGIPTGASLIMSNLLRSEGYARQSGIGLTTGGIVNIVLDPILIFVLGWGVKGAAIATLISNIVSAVYFIIVFKKLKDKLIVSIKLADIGFDREMVKAVFNIGFPAFISTILASVMNIVNFNMLSKYGDIPVSAFGITKKLDMLPMSFCMGVTGGILPILAYNYASGNKKRMKKCLLCGAVIGGVFTIVYAICGRFFGAELVRIFIDHKETIAVGATFVGIECIVTPIMSINNILNTQLQAMGKGTATLILSACRNAAVKIPAAIILERIMGRDGIVWSGFAAEAIMLVASVIILLLFWKNEERNLSKGILQ